MEKKYTFNDLIEIMEKLRSPDGCPWDRKQTHSSLVPYLIEETYEVIDAIRKENDEELKEELGDLL
ncbi:MAG: MazG nucleotide pyrophosphohydrolase domain-containing protein, partial [Desulfurobacteriaceae bacterium]